MKSIALLVTFLILGLGFTQAQDSTTVMKRICQNSKTTDSIDIQLVILDKSTNVAIPFAVVLFYSKGKNIGFMQAGLDGRCMFTLFYSDLMTIGAETIATSYKKVPCQPLVLDSNKKVQIFLTPELRKIQSQGCSFGPPNEADLTTPGQFEIDADFIKHSAYR